VLPFPGSASNGLQPFTGPAGLFRQRTEPSKPQRDLLAKLGIAVPKQIVELSAPS
jgi:hypothetical protein